MVEEKVLQPLLSNISALKLATETVRMILKIDDIVECCFSSHFSNMRLTPPFTAGGALNEE